MYVEARGRCGQDRFVTQICPAGGLGGAVSPQRGPRNQAHFWQQSTENWRKIRSLTSHVGKHESTYFNNYIVL